MRNKLKAFILGAFVTGALLATTGQVFANDYWHWSKEHNRWDRRADLRSDRHDLGEAKRQLDHDRSHHASRHKLAEDEARIRDIEHDIYADRR
jgi:hypothetical protein